jgi:Na+/glutamate symporter
MSTASSIHGTWIYAEDPAGEFAGDPVYVGSTVHFGADDTYQFTMGQITLEGTYTAESSGGTVQTKVTLSSGSEMTIAVATRDGGIVVHEGDGTLPGRFYTAKQH